jgi:hypothetical protein
MFQFIFHWIWKFFYNFWFKKEVLPLISTPILYEDKYKEAWNNLEKISLVFTDLEKEQFEKVLPQQYFTEYQARLKDKILDKMKELEKNKNMVTQQQLMVLRNELQDLSIESFERQAFKEALKERMKTQFSNSYIIENTPSGNVLMLYDAEKDAFVYYSDQTISRRYLETVGRKYVKTFFCQQIYLDANRHKETIQREKDKLKILMEQEIERRKNQESQEKQKQIEKKPKGIFVQLKKYNVAVPDELGVQDFKLVKEIKLCHEEILRLEEQSNKYVCRGKMCDFSFLQKIDKKLFQTTLKMSYADFKTKIIKSNL